jgi:Flp pilus assembly protein TadD
VKRWGGLALVAVVSSLVYLPALHNGFTGDDQGLIVDNPHLADARLSDIFSRDFAYGASAAHALNVSYYRPLVNLSFWLDRKVWGLNPFGFHLNNLLLNVIACLLVFLILSQLLSKSSKAQGLKGSKEILAPLLGAVLFALHPMHVESVASVSGRTDLIMAVLVLLSFYLLLLADGARPTASGPRPAAGRQPSAVSRWPSRPVVLTVLAGISFALALLAKETAIMFVVFVPIWLLSRQRSAEGRSEKREGRRVKLTLHPSQFTLLIAAGYLVLRSSVIHSPLRLTPNVLAAQFPALMLNSLGLDFKLIFLPFRHQPYYPLRGQFLSFTAYTLAALVLLVAAVWGLVVGKRTAPSLRLAVCGLWLSILFLLPVSNLLFLSGPMAAERFLYLPSFGVVLAVTVLLARGLRGETKRSSFIVHRSSLLLVPALAIVVAFAVNTARACTIWRDDLTLAQAITRATPDFAMAHNQLGVALKRRGDLAGAFSEFQQAIRLQPDYAQAHNGLGTVLESQHNLPAALAEYRLAVHYDSTDIVARNNLGSVFGAVGNPDSAAVQFQAVLRLNPSDPEAHQNLGVALYSLGEAEPAEEQFREAIRLMPDYEKALVNLARLLLIEDKRDEAAPFVERAARLAPGDPAVQELTGILKGK